MKKLLLLLFLMPNLVMAGDNKIIQKKEKLSFNRLHHTFADKSSAVASKADVKEHKKDESQKVLEEKAFEIYSARYAAKVKKEIAAQLQYPRFARRRMFEGEVLLILKIDGQGNLIDSSIKQSSGYKVLDDEVMSTAKRTSPFPKPPKELDISTVQFEVPFIFKLE